MVAVYLLAVVVVVVDYHGINFFEPLKERGGKGGGWAVTPHYEIIVGDEPPCIF